MGFDLQPTLSSTLVDARPLRSDDFAELFSVASDPLIWEQHPEANRFERAVFEAFFRAALESEGALLVVDAQTGRTIGSSRYHGYDEQRSEVEIGWTFLARSHWGGRYNGELKRLMLQHAFAFVETVVFNIGETNYRSQRAVEKIGGRRTASCSALTPPDRVVYEITRPRYEVRPKPA